MSAVNYPTLDWTAQPGVIDIACTSDWRYLPHTGAMLHSLFAHSPGERFRVVLLHGDNVNDAERERLRQLAAPFGAEIHCVEIAPERIEGLPILHLHPSVWYRVLLPQILPQLPRILYLDSDMIVLDRVRPLWDLALGTQLFACAGNALHSFNVDVIKLLDLPGPSAYLNSGVMLMNLAQMREEHSIAKIFEYAPQHPENPSQDQDAYSALFHDRALRLAPRWNMQVNFFDLGAAEVARQIGATAADVASAMKTPAIVHFIGPYKPWRIICRYPFREHYFTHRRQTPWPVEPLETISYFDPWVRYLPITLQAPYFKTYDALRPLVRRLRARLRR